MRPAVDKLLKDMDNTIPHITTTEAQYTPLPWFAVHNSPLIVGPSGETVATISYDQQGLRRGQETSEANARFIVTACNSHAALLAACEDAEKALVRASGILPPHYGDRDKAAWDVDEAIDLLRAALASARKVNK